MRILIDADACPKLAKDVLYKISERFSIELILVANSYISIPYSDLIKFIQVSKGPDEADNHIVDIMNSDDLIISSDIPLADRVIKKGGVILDPRGQFLTQDNVGQRLATRNLMDDLRTEGMNTGGPSSYSNKDKQQFNNQLDKFLTRSRKKK